MKKMESERGMLFSFSWIRGIRAYLKSLASVEKDRSGFELVEVEGKFGGYAWRQKSNLAMNVRSTGNKQKSLLNGS